MSDRDELASNAVLGALSARNPKLITADLEQHFRELRASKTALVSDTFTPSGARKITRASNAFAVPRHGSFSLDRVYAPAHNPFRTRYTVETPQDHHELIKRYRYYYETEPLVGAAIDLHTEYPMSKFEITHEDPVLQEQFSDMMEDLNMTEFLTDMVREYWQVGECFPYGIFDDANDPSTWKHFMLLDPMYVDVKSSPMTDGRPASTIRLKMNGTIKSIIEKGPDDKITGDLYKGLPADVIACVKEKDGYMKLNPLQCSHFKRKSNTFKERGDSIIKRVLHLLSYRDKLRDGNYSMLDRFITPREIWKVGSEKNPASIEELQALADMVQASYADPSQAIIWHHALQVDIIGAADKLLPIRQELDGVEQEILIGLMLNKGFLDSSYGQYANMSISLDVLINRYMNLRQRIERWLADAVFAPICRLNNIYKPTQAELAHRIRIKNAPKRPWVPKVTWEKFELRDPTQKMNLLLSLRDKLGKPGFPRDLIYRSMGFNPRMIDTLVEQEKKKDVINNQVSLNNAPGLGGGAGAPPPGMDMGGLEMPPDMGQPPAGGAGGNTTIPTTGDAGQIQLNTSNPAQAPQSQNVQNVGT